MRGRSGQALVLLIGYSLLHGAIGAEVEKGVSVEVKLVGTDSLDLTYRLPEGCNKLPFETSVDKNVATRLRKTWIRTGTCGEIVDGALAAGPACRAVRFKIPTNTEINDRTYPPAYPIEGLGVYLHTGVYAPGDACGPVRWTFSAPGGQVVFDGMRRGVRFDAPGEGPGHASFASVYLSSRPIAATTGSITVYAPSVPSWVRETLEDATRQVDARYRSLAGDLGLHVPAVVVTNLENGGTPRVQADVSNQRMMRIGLQNIQAKGDSPEARNFLRGLIAHEFAHVLQNPQLGDDEIGWEAEGGAETLRWLTKLVSCADHRRVRGARSPK